MAVKWGVLGTAGIARGCTIPGMKEAENCELYAIAGRDEKKTEAFKEEFGFEKAYIGYDKLIEDPDVQALYIPLPNHIHKEWTIRALKAGKHVLCEKPLALNADDVREMFETAKENNVFLMEAFAYLHSPYIPMLKKDIESGMIGEVDYIEAEFLDHGHIDDIRVHKDTGGGAVYDLGCYCTTTILSLVDSDPQYVSGNADFDDFDVDIFSSVYIKFKNNVRASFNAGMIFDPGSAERHDRLFIHGSKGRILSDVEYNQSGTLHYTILSQGMKTERTFEAGQNYALEVRQLGRCIEEGEEPYVSADFSIRNAELIDLILKKLGY